MKDIANRLDDFFLNESEIEIENERLIKKINSKLIEQIKTGQKPDEERIKKILNQQLAGRESFSKEDIEDTAYSLFVILNDYWQYERIMAGVEKIINKYAPQASKNQKLKDDLRDDLWLLNEKYFAVPKAIAANQGIKGDRVFVHFIQSGMPVIFTKLDASLMKSQIQSLLIALVLVTIILIVQLKSITGGLISITPIVLTVLFNFAIMAYFNIPLDNATMMIASIAIGIGIDYSIHFTNRFKEEFARNKNATYALEKTLTTTGRAILINALSVAAGFIILLFAQLIPIQRFGWLTATTMFFSSLSAITFLPALILITRARFIGDFNGIFMTGKKQLEKVLK